MSAILMNMSMARGQKKDIEVEARKLGMVYPSEISNVDLGK